MGNERGWVTGSLLDEGGTTTQTIVIDNCPFDYVHLNYTKYKTRLVGICFTQVATTCCVVRRNWIRATTRCRHSLSQADTPHEAL